MSGNPTRSLKVSVTQPLIDAWAQLSGDMNPLHVSHEYSSKTRFGGTIAHGHFAIALMEGLLLRLLGDVWLNGGTLSNVKFMAPVRSGAEVEIVAEPAEGGWSLKLREVGGPVVCVAGTATIS